MGALGLFLLTEACSGEWAIFPLSWYRALFVGPGGGFFVIMGFLIQGFLLSGGFWALLATTTYDGRTVKLVWPFEAPHCLLFSRVSGRVVSRSWGPSPPLPVALFGLFVAPPSRGVPPNGAASCGS
jgi:hypothetical protein